MPELTGRLADDGGGKLRRVEIGAAGSARADRKIDFETRSQG